jgi:hypothetical protein
MDKKQKIERKIQRRWKNRSKHAKIDVERLRQEILGYRFYFPNQTPWNQSFPDPRDHNSNIVNSKNHQQESREIKHED